jgi:hypothetical protein
MAIDPKLIEGLLAGYKTGPGGITVTQASVCLAAAGFVIRRGPGKLISRLRSKRRGERCPSIGERLDDV